MLFKVKDNKQGLLQRLNLKNGRTETWMIKQQP